MSDLSYKSYSNSGFTPLEIKRRGRSLISGDTRFLMGFTLIEVLVVLGIFLLVASLTLFVGLDSYRGYSFRSERDTAVMVLQKARSQAMSNTCFGACPGNDGKKHGVHFDLLGNQYIIFQGMDYASRDAPVDQFVPVNNGVTILASSDIIFNQLDGTGSGGTVIINDATSHNSTITINPEGQITWTF